MPTTQASQQTYMKVYMGKAPHLNSNRIIDNMAFKMNVVAKTADYSVLASESGTFFTDYGCTGTISFTLPAAADGLIYWFMSVAAGALTVTGPDETLVTHNDATADAVAFDQANEIIGNGFMCFSDGTLWYVAPIVGAHTSTITVTSA